MRLRFFSLIAVFHVAFMSSQLPAQQPPDSKTPIIGNAPPAQLPTANPPSTPAIRTGPVAPQAATERFDNTALQLKTQDGKWQVWAGNLLIKDFGNSEREADEALQVLRDLRVNSHGSVGGVFEYWLTDDHAPYAVMRHKEVIPFDLHTLRVEQMSGQWVLRDAHVVLYNFGHAQADARQALAICQQYEFNQLGFVGHPTPSIKYLMKDSMERPPAPTAPSLVPVSAAMQATELSRPRLTLAGVGDIGDRVPFDSRHLDLRREGRDWVLYAGRAVVGHFGSSERDAQLTMETLERYRVTELCHVGDTGFSFFLTNGRPPQGSVLGSGAKPLRTEQLSVRQVAGSWAVCDGTRVVFDFGAHADDARHVLAAIKEYHFDHVAAIGNGRMGNVYLFVKSGY